MRTPAFVTALSISIATFGGLAKDSRAVTPVVPPPRLTGASATVMAENAVARATAKDATEGDVLTSALVLTALDDGLPFGTARAALEKIAGAAKDATAEAGREVQVLARTIAPDEGTDAGVAADKRLGIVTDVSILGPFRDTGGGFAAAIGPEQPGKSFANAEESYAWGSFDVRWRVVPPRYVSATGVPLDVFIAPRKESCSFLASRITIDRARPIVLRLAATGQAALFFDGVAVGKSDEVHASASFDRIAGRIEAEAGDHLVVAKTCSGALDDAGRVRIRITDEKGAPLPLPASAQLKAPASPPRVAPVMTALDRVASPRASGTAALLPAIAVRTLGGADDLKSPRAPGMLDTFTQDKSLDADKIAFAAWITPSGANRTGWYARALERSASDPGTGTFVKRQLVAERLRARMSDWALAGFKAAGLDKEKDDQAAILRARIDNDTGVEALRLRAMRSLLERWSKLEDAPTTALGLIAALGDTFNPPVALRARNALAARGYIDPGFVRALGVARGDAARAAAVALVAGRLDDADEGVEAARALAEIGDYATAHRALIDLAGWAPNRANVLTALAETRAADPAAKRDESVNVILKRARELAPGDARIRAQLALRQNKVTAPQPDERHLVASDVLLKRRGGVPKPGEPAEVRERQLHWLRAVRKHPDKRVSQLIHYAREVVIAPRSQDELYENLPLEGDVVEILRARVHRRDGTVAFPLEEHNEGTRPRVRWPELAPGDTVEVAIRTWTDGPVGGRGDPPFYFLDYAGSTATTPIVYNEVVVESQSENPIFVDVVNGAPDRRDEKDEQGVHVTRLIWDKPKTVPDEPLSPQLTELVPVVVGSTFRTWNDFRAWYTEAIRGFTEPDAEVRRLAAELTKGKTTREAKLKALFEFVADQIRYVNYVSGEFWLPNRPHQLLARREGDCDDKAILLITLLRAVGIEAQEVLVQTRETGQPSVLRAKNAAAPLFDHGIAFLPGPNGGTYLDATSPQSRLGPLPAMDARGSALPIRTNATAEIVELPSGVPEDHGSDVDWTITLTPGGGGAVKGTETHAGDSAFYLRTYLAQEGARASYVEGNLLSPWVPTVEVDGTIEFAGDLPGGRARVGYRAKSDAIARREGNELVVPLAPNRTLASQLAPLVKRTLPVSLPTFLAPSRQRRAVRIIAPDGYVWGDLPAGGKVDGGEFGRAELEIGVDPKNPRAILARRSVVLDRHVIPVASYEAWRGFLKQIDALMSKGVRLVPTRGGK